MKKVKIIIPSILSLAILSAAGYYGYSQYDLKKSKNTLSDYAAKYNQNKEKYIIKDSDDKNMINFVNSALNGRSKEDCESALIKLKNYESNLKFDNSTELIKKLQSINYSNLKSDDKNKIDTIKNDAKKLIDSADFKSAKSKILEIEKLIKTSEENTKSAVNNTSSDNITNSTSSSADTSKNNSDNKIEPASQYTYEKFNKYGYKLLSYGITLKKINDTTLDVGIGHYFSFAVTTKPDSLESISSEDATADCTENGRSDQNYGQVTYQGNNLWSGQVKGYGNDSESFKLTIKISDTSAYCSSDGGIFNTPITLNKE